MEDARRLNQDGYVRDCVAYLRKSKGVTLGKQRRGIQKRAAELGWHIIAELSDTDSTAYAEPGADRAPREDYEKMLAILAADTSSPPIGVLAWHIDRILRDPRDAEDFIPICRNGRHPVETDRSGGYELWTATGLKRLRNDVTDAAYEVDHLIERLTSDKTEKALAGRWHGGPVPFGWRLERLDIDDDEKVLVLDPPAAEAIAWGCKQVLLGTTLAAIAREWNGRGLRCKSGGEYEGYDVRRVLRRSRNAGLMTHKKTVIQTELEGGKAAWPPIVSEETWRAVMEVLDDPARATPGSREPRWLGSSLYECGMCGGTVRTGSGSGGGADNRHKMRVYRCKSGKKGHPVRTAEPLDAYVEATMIARLSRPDVAAWLAAQEPPDVDGLRDRLRGERAKLATWRRLAEADEITPESFAAAEKGCLARIKTIQAELTASKSSPIIADLVEADDVEALWDSKSLSWRRSAIRLLVTVTVNRTRPGRPAWWRPGESYFNPDAIDFGWKPLGGVRPPA